MAIWHLKLTKLTRVYLVVLGYRYDVGDVVACIGGSLWPLLVAWHRYLRGVRTRSCFVFMHVRAGTDLLSLLT